MNTFPDKKMIRPRLRLLLIDFINIGIDRLSEGKPCFIDFTEKLLRLKLSAYSRPREIVVEILETV